MTLTTRGKRLVFALYSLAIATLVYLIMTIDNDCIDEDLARFTSQAYHYGTPEEKEKAIEIIYQWRGGIQLKNDGTHEIIFQCVTVKQDEKIRG
jgi:hypothetical protein